MPLSRRYVPEKPPGEASLFGLDFSPIIPPGVGIASGTLTIETNTQPPQYATDWTIEGQPAAPSTPTRVRDRTLYAMLDGGTLGRDYLLHWVAYDTSGNTWPRTVMCLCAQTS